MDGGGSAGLWAGGVPWVMRYHLAEALCLIGGVMRSVMVFHAP